MPSVNAFYWFLTALSTELYMIMYVLMFLAAIKLHYQDKGPSKGFKIPGGTLGTWIVSLLGLSGCLVTIIVSFLPPDNVNIGSSLNYLWMIVAGNVFTISPLFFIFLYQKKSQKKEALSVQTIST